MILYSTEQEFRNAVVAAFNQLMIELSSVIGVEACNRVYDAYMEELT